MATGGGACREVVETQPMKSANFDMAAATKRRPEKSSALVKYAGGRGSEKMDRRLNNDVHQLLECPVCRNSMLPPIFQVSLLIFRRLDCVLSFNSPVMLLLEQTLCLVYMRLLVQNDQNCWL